MSLNVLMRGQGRPLLLLHGFTGTAGTWALQVDRWATSHRVIAPDLLGHGRSDAPPDPSRYALERQASEIADLLGLLDAKPADVVGYSMGARLALVLALHGPALVQRLVLESPSAGIADASARARRRAADGGLAADIERDGVEAFVARWERLPMFATHATLPAEVRDRQRRERTSHDPRGLAASLRGAGQGAMTPLHERLATIGVPVLILAGELDEMGRARARDVTRSMPAARLQVITGAGHTPHLERPDDFIDAVDDFLSDTPAIAVHRGTIHAH